MQRIVVGYDGSESARAALEFATQEAARHKASLRVVSCWHVPLLPAPGPAPTQEANEAYRKEAEAAASEAVVRAKKLKRRLRCESAVLFGDTGEILVEESREAGLLVVGRRGQGGLAGLLRSSTNRYVVEHSHCPVTVVPLSSD